jgi:hypothetical protein
LALALTACGDDDRAGSLDPVPIEALPTVLAGAACSKLEACYADLSDVVDALLGGCRARVEGSVTNATLPRVQMAIAMGTVVYDEMAAGACIGALSSASCSTIASGSLESMCAEAFQGTVALGGMCNIDEECEGDAFCQFGGSCPGTCTATGAAGADCSGDDQCAAGLQCNAGSCAAPAGHGAACGGPSGGADCAGGDFCVGESSTSAGICRSPGEIFTVAEGGTCDVKGFVLCRTGLSCTAMASAGGAPVFVCRPGVGAGAACSVGFPDPCPDDQFCDADISAGELAGMCRALPTAGQACARGVFTRCAEGFICNSGTCARVQPNGGPCTMSDECFSSTCDGTVCTAPPFCEGG